MGTIVVGIDGSECSEHALRFAISEARIRGTDVRAVIAWSVPYYEFPLPVEDVRGGAQAVLDRSIERVLAEQTEPVPSIQRSTVQGQAAFVLIGESMSAELLVVGSRGHGAVAALLLGSTSNQCAHHAGCPIAIVRGAAIS